MSPKENVECPRCGSPMELKRARRGRNAGGMFYGCADFPRCRMTLDANNAAHGARRNIDPDSRELEQNLSCPIFLKARERFSGYQVRFYESLAVPVKLRKEINDGSVDRVKLEEWNKWRLDYPIQTSTQLPSQVKTIFSVINKILTRGRITLLSPFLENELLTYFNTKSGSYRDRDFNEYFTLVKPEKETSFVFDGYTVQRNTFTKMY